MCYRYRLELSLVWWQWWVAQHSSKLQHYWSLTIRLFSAISRTFVGEVLPLCRDAVVFCSPCWMGQIFWNWFLWGSIIISASDGDAPVLGVWEVWNIPLLLLLPVPLWSGVVVPGKVLFMGQINLFKNYFYSIGPYAKNTQNTLEQLSKNINMHMIP